LYTCRGLERFWLGWWEQFKRSSCIAIQPSREGRTGLSLQAVLFDLTCLDFRKKSSFFCQVNCKRQVWEENHLFLGKEEISIGVVFK
jgi:hypothetical protein